MLQAKTEKQIKRIAKILGLKKDAFRELVTLPEKNVSPIHTIMSEVAISFDQMAEIVDYLRKENEEIVFPTSCKITSDANGTLLDLRETPHNEVMQFCERLAWVRGHDFGFWYDQYVTHGKIWM